MTLAKAKLASSITFIVLASFMIVTYDRQNMFIIQATVLLKMFQKVDKEKNHYDEKSPKSKKPYRLKLYMTS
jgi:hypothetical protein